MLPSSKMLCPSHCVHLFERNEQRRRSSLLSPLFKSSNLSSSIIITLNIGWTPPPEGVIKLNFNDSLSLDGVATGHLLRDSHGRFIKAGTRFMFAALILVSEATALWDGLKAALDAGYRHLHMERDNRIIIQAVKDDIHISW